MTRGTVARGRVTRMGWITRRHVQANPGTLFVFGDNMARAGMGGQAREMRGEPNAVGVPTKWTPRRDDAAYFTDGDWDNEAVRRAIGDAFLRLDAHLGAGLDVVIPAAGIGTGLADLQHRAPRIHRLIERCIGRLEQGPENEP